jgi:hypothetical protein
VAGAWFAGKYARTYFPTWFGAGATASSAGATNSASSNDPAAATNHGGAQPAAGALPTDKQAGALRDAAAALRRVESAEATSPPRHSEPAAAHEAGHEAAPRRRAGAKDFVGRDLAGLKMAPDPSLLPAPAPPPAPKTADPPPPAPPAAEAP